ncbi:MAG: PP2C family protein-serine/threonine phosphatase [Vicinamibacteria bacterium]
MSVASPRVLVADDQADVRIALELLLKAEGCEVDAVDSPAGVLAAASRGGLDLVLMDLNYSRDTTSGAEGLALLPRLRSLDGELPVVAMTAWGTLELAVEAMKRGARDFVLKPWDNATLVRTVRGALAAGRNGATTPADSARPTDHDLDVARRVQAGLLPHSLPELARLEYAGACRQAGAVGGDAFDVLPLGEGRLALVLGDASGKGVSGALLMSHLLGCLRGRLDRMASDPLPSLRALNRQFFESTAPEHYATLFYADLEDEGRWLRYVNCGHNPALLLRADGRLDRLAATAPAVGLFDDWPCAAAELRLEPGDLLCVYSDGVTEATSGAGEEYGEERLAETLRTGRELTPLGLGEAVLRSVEAFAGAVRGDDRTVVIARAR